MSYLGQQLGQGQAERFIYTATGGETSVTSDDLGRAIAYTVGQVDVYLNGAKLINGSDFTATTGTSITGLAALTASDVLEVFALSIFQASDTVSAASGGTFNGNVTVDADLSVTGTVDIDTSLNIDGTVTADGLTVDGVSNLNGVAQVGGSTDLLFLSGKTGSHAYVSLGATNTAADFFIGADTAVPLIFRTSATERMRIDSSGNVGIGVTPAAWRTAGGEKVLQIDTASIYNNSANDYYLNNNWYLNSSAQSIYIESDYATSFSSQAGKFIWYQAPSGTAGNTISFTQAMTLDASGNLLVGKTTTAGAFNTVGTELRSTGLVQSTVDGSKCIDLNRKTSDGDIIGFSKDGTTVGSIGVDSNNLYIANSYSATKSGLKFGGNITPMEGASDSDGETDLGATDTRFKDLYLSGGVYLGGTGAANLLDDYEEGTWTPAYSTSGGSFTYDSATYGSYTKIGNVVTVYFRIYTSSATVGSGDVTITGLPFAESIVSGTGAGSIGDCRLFSGDHPDTLLVSGSDIWPYYRTSSNGANARLQASDLNTGTTKNLIDGQITYITAA